MYIMAHMHAEGDIELGGAPKISAPKSMSDNWFQKIEDYITSGISRFVAFLFFLVTLGAVLGYIVAIRGEGEYLILVPAAAGILSYYSRDFAVAAFGLFVILIFIL